MLMYLIRGYHMVAYPFLRLRSRVKFKLRVRRMKREDPYRYTFY